jgi:hypothetical protein
MWDDARACVGSRPENNTSGAKALIAVAFYGPTKVVP